MQPFEFTNDSFPLDAYFFPPTNDTGFASVASSSNPEPFLLPSEIDLLFDLIDATTNNFLPLQGFTMDSNMIQSDPSMSLPDTDPPPGIPKAQSPVRKTRVRNKEHRREKERKKVLQDDKFILSFKDTWVTCRGCGKIIKLDSRNGARYYPGFWEKHKKRCDGVKEEIAAEKRRKREEAQEGSSDVFMIV